MEKCLRNTFYVTVPVTVLNENNNSSVREQTSNIFVRNDSKVKIKQDGKMAIRKLGSRWVYSRPLPLHRPSDHYGVAS